MSNPPKKSYNQKVDFSDTQIYEEIKDQVREIKERNLKKVEEESKIYELYLQRKHDKRKQKFLHSKADKINNAGMIKERDSSDEEEGEIPERPAPKNIDFFATDFNFEGVPSISNLGQHIRPLTLTRNKIVDLLNSRRFEELVKGCFVRYLIDSTSQNNNTYIIAQIVGVTEGNKEYTVNNVKTRVLLKLQETSESVVTLSLQLISNQHPPGGLEIEKWLQTNRNKIPKEKQLKEKLEEHNKLLVEQLSSNEIDSNIWNKAKKIAEQKQEPKEDIQPLIDFVIEKIHNFQVDIEEEKLGRNAKGNLPKLQQEYKEAKGVLDALEVIKGQMEKNRSKNKTFEPKKGKKYDLSLITEKRNDDVSEKCKSRSIMLSTYEGYVKLRQNLQEAHMKYNVELDEEDRAF